MPNCSQQSASPISSSGEEGSSGWGAYVLQAGLEVVEHDRWDSKEFAVACRVQLTCCALTEILHAHMCCRRWASDCVLPSLRLCPCRRFSTGNATLNAMLRLAVDNFRRRSYLSV
jgi:hypothetical protein